MKRTIVLCLVLSLLVIMSSVALAAANSTSKPKSTSKTTASKTIAAPASSASKAAGRAALKEKTRAMMSKSPYAKKNVTTDLFGPKYHSKGGAKKGLPDKYSMKHKD